MKNIEKIRNMSAEELAEKGLQNAKMHKEKHSYSDEFINGFINGYERALDVVKRGVI